MLEYFSGIEMMSLRGDVKFPGEKQSILSLNSVQ